MLAGISDTIAAKQLSYFCFVVTVSYVTKNKPVMKLFYVLFQAAAKLTLKNHPYTFSV